MKQKRERLTWEERIMVAYFHHVEGDEQAKLARMMRVNQGRIAEACKAIKFAAQYPLELNKEPRTR